MGDDKDGSSEYPHLGKDKSKSQASLEFHDFLLREIRTSFKDVRSDNQEVRKDVQNMRVESAKVLERLDTHIRTCDEERRTALTPKAPGTTSFTAPWYKKRIVEKCIDYGVLMIIFLVIKYGHYLPVPS